MRKRAIAIGLCLVALVAVMAAPAYANRPLIDENAVEIEEVPGGIEGACGIVVASEKIYVSDYYHHSIAVFGANGGAYIERIPVGPLNGSCQLAASTTGLLYANIWHEGVSRVLPSALDFDSAESTGVAVDQASGNVYVNDRTYVAVYEPTGAPVLKEGVPLRIGVGSLVDAYGLAVDGGRVYVPDAADNTVKVFEPATNLSSPVAVIDGADTPQGRFVSLVDTAIAVAPTNGHLLVLDNLQPGFEFPRGAIEEFDSSGAFLGELAKKVIHGEPGGLAFKEDILYATSGNSEESTVFEFGPYTSGGLFSVQSAPSTAPQSAATAPPAAASAGLDSSAPTLRLASASPAADGSATLAVVLPADGTLAATGKGLRSQRRHLEAGRRVLHLHPNRAGRRALAKAGALKVRVRVAFTPDIGTTLHASRTLVFETGKETVR